MKQNKILFVGEKLLVSTFILSSFVYADDYDFNFDELETIKTKSYEYKGYIKGDYKYQSINKSSSSYPSKNKSLQNSYLGEFFLNYKYFKDKYTFHLDLMSNYENIDHKENDKNTINQSFINYKYNNNHQIYLGKKSPKWGKGYYINPVAFIDRKKDPNDPEASREGFIQFNYKYNKVLKNELKNITFDMVYLKTTKDINEELYNDKSNILALKTYMLYKDIDIDIIYLYNDKDANKIGFDFSTNIESNFEIHGEYGRFDNSYYSYLLGLKYLTQNDLTILSEYYYQNMIQAKNSPFWDNRYFINSFTQKEPFDTLYLNIYYKNILNTSDNSHQNRIGLIYSKIKNLNIDFSISKNKGKNSSEYGNKLVDNSLWLSLKYSF